VAKIGIILGSDSDLPKVKGCFTVLEDFGVDFEIIISSAHRTPEQTRAWVGAARDRGLRAIIAVAGGAAHLPGVVASHTTLPVIGVPVENSISGRSGFNTLHTSDAIRNTGGHNAAGRLGGPMRALRFINPGPLDPDLV
jgi:phosphoribosylaminoimidazole carboxylase PurE protein